MNTSVNLTVEDLTRIRSYLDLACTRGAFRAIEMKDVGESFARLDAFLVSIEKNVQADANTNEPPEGEQND